MLELIESWLAGIGLAERAVIPASVVIACLVVATLAFVAHAVTRRIILRVISRIVEKTKTTRDDLLLQNRVFERLSHLVPGIIIQQLGVGVLSPYPILSQTVDTLSLVYISIIVVLVIMALINTAVDIYNTFSFAAELPIRGTVQVVKLVIYLIGFIIVASLLLDESPASLFTAMGAIAAGLTFVFKDSILGFVAGIQLTANRMVAVGDWIEMPKYGVDGDVMDIAMTTVKVRNFDKTITTVPTYALISDSFKNWRGMKQTGGRRIKRSIYIDISSIRFCDEKMLERFSKMAVLKDYLTEKRRELDAYNREKYQHGSPMTDGRHLTNIGTYRAYLHAYLRSHPNVSQNLTLLVRQLPTTAEGLPIELYFFTNVTDWITYENIQSDIFDHIFAASHEFGLRIYQNPTGTDFKELSHEREG